MGLAEVPGQLLGLKGPAVRELFEARAGRSCGSCAPQDADHAGESEEPGDHAEPCEPDGAVREMSPGAAQDAAVALRSADGPGLLVIGPPGFSKNPKRPQVWLF